MNDAPSPPTDRLHLLDVTMFWSASSGGVRRYVGEKAAWAAEHPAWRHTIATPVLDAQSRVRLPAVPLPGSGGYRLPLRRGAAARLIAAQRPDVIEAGDPYRLAWSVLDAADRIGVPAVAFCHSNLEAMARRLGGAAAGRAAARYVGHLYRQFDLVLAPSRALQQRLAGWDVPRTLHQPLGVDTRVFRPRDVDPDWRRAFDMPPDARVLVYAGRFAPEKNLGLLTAAVQRLGAPYWLLAVGAGPVPPKGERVRRVPHVGSADRLAALLSAADVFVHAGDQETFGLAALEALACGTPLVARAADGLAELVDERVGMPVHRGTAEAFAEAIAAVFARGPVAFAAEARQRALAHDWREVLPPLFLRYQRLAGRTLQPAPGAPGAPGAPTRRSWLEAA